MSIWEDRGGWPRLPPLPASGSPESFIGLFVLAVAVFLPAVRADFVWDDLLIERIMTDTGAGLADLWLEPSRTARHEVHYWPVVWTAFWFEHQLWGLNPVGYHLVNVALHGLNAVLVFAILRRLQVSGAWPAAAVFAVHPVHVDSVVWAIEMKDVLSAFFYLAAALYYLAWWERPRSAAGSWRSGATYAGSVALFVLGVLSKSIAVTLPAALLVVHWWRRGRVSARAWASTAPYFLIAAAITVGDLAYSRDKGRQPDPLGLLERAQVVARSFWHYVSKLFWPGELSPMYALWDVSAGDVAGWVILAAALAAAAALWMLRGRIGRGPLAGLLFFGITLGPVLGVVGFEYQLISYVADRYQYLASIGLIVAVVGGVAHLTTVRRARRAEGAGIRRCDALEAAAGVVCLLLVAVLGAATWRQALIYESPERFWSHVIDKSPAAPSAYVGLAGVYRDEGRLEDSIRLNERALEVGGDDYFQALLGLALAYADLGDQQTAAGNVEIGEDYHQRAEEMYRRVLELRPDEESARTNLGGLLLGRGEYQQAEELNRQNLDGGRLGMAAEIDTFTNLAVIYVMQGRLDDARAAVAEGRSKFPDNGKLAATHRVLSQMTEADLAAERVRRGVELISGGDVAAGIDELQTALTIDPGHVAAYIQLGVVHQANDEAEDAERNFRAAFDLAAEHPDAAYHLADFLAGQERYQEALDRYDDAVAAMPQRAGAHLGRGVALMHLQRLDEALASLERAVALDSGLELARRNRDRVLAMMDQSGDEPDPDG